MLFSERSFTREEKYFCSNDTAINVNFYSVSLRAKGPGEKSLGKISSPASVRNITKENTYPNSTQDLPLLQPSDLTKKLINSSKVKIENPDLIRMLNESSINSTPFAIGYRAIVYLGQWPLNYESTETSPNWEFQKINTNYFDNRGGKVPYQIKYVQESQKIIRGGLTAKIANAEDVKKMMLLKAMEKTQSSPFI